MKSVPKQLKQLVDALESTGLLEAFVARNPSFSTSKDDFMQRGVAEVYCFPSGAYVGPRIDILFERVVRDMVDDGSQWESSIKISRRYIPDSDPAEPIEYSYDISIRAFNPNEDKSEQIESIQMGINFLTKSVTKNSKKF